MFQIGEFNQRISVQEQGSGINELNERTASWSDAFAAWARVRPVSQRDEVGADQPHAVGSYIFTIRSHSGLPVGIERMRVVWKGGTYYVSGEPIKLDGCCYLQIRATSQKVNDV